MPDVAVGILLMRQTYADQGSHRFLQQQIEETRKGCVTTLRLACRLFRAARKPMSHAVTTGMPQAATEANAHEPNSVT